jgi:hypothetical protein
MQWSETLIPQLRGPCSDELFLIGGAAVVRTFVVIPALAAFSALAFALPAPEPAAVLYYPTKVGAKWVYDDDGGTYTFVVAKVQPKGEANLVTVDVVTPGGPTQHSHTMEVSRRGLREVENFNRKWNPPVPRLYLTHLPGAKWECRHSLDGQDRGISQMEAGAAERISVPAGTFQAVRVETLSTWDDAQQRLTKWYAPDVGLVREIYRPGSSRDLKSFEPGVLVPAPK